ncbi:unnamed protein product [Ixodes persulcatus]
MTAVCCAGFETVVCMSFFVSLFRVLFLNYDCSPARLRFDSYFALRTGVSSIMPRLCTVGCALCSRNGVAAVVVSRAKSRSEAATEESVAGLGRPRKAPIQSSAS